MNGDAYRELLELLCRLDRAKIYYELRTGLAPRL